MTGRERATANGEPFGSPLVWTVIAAAYIALIFFVSSRPYLHAPGPQFMMKDKVAHFAEYAVLGALLARIFLARSLRPAAVVVFVVVAIAASIAAADEVYQGTVPGRMRSVTDWVADVLGAAAGAGAALALVRDREPALAKDEER